MMIRGGLLGLAVLLWAAAPLTRAQNIYKCTQAGRVTYTDQPCAGHTGKVLHQADDTDIIDQYLRLGQDAAARNYARAHHLDALYQTRVEVHQRRLQESAQRLAENALAAQQRDADAHQRALTDAAANAERLRTENDTLRQQNDQYRDQLAEPVYNPPPAFWPVMPPYRDRPHGHRPPRADEPVFHPCTQLAGGRVQC